MIQQHASRSLRAWSIVSVWKFEPLVRECLVSKERIKLRRKNSMNASSISAPGINVPKVQQGLKHTLRRALLPPPFIRQLELTRQARQFELLFCELKILG